jgi:hypothetical protein
MATIGGPGGLHNPVVASIDTIELWCLYLQKGQRISIEKALGRKIKIVPCKRAGFLCRRAGYRIAINRPPLQLLPVLNTILHSSRWNRVSRVDIAYDFAPMLAPFLRNHVVLKWWRGSRWAKGDSMYWKRWKKGMRRSRRNLVVYEKGDSARLELRDHSAKIDDLLQLVDLDPRAFFLQNVKLLRLSDIYVNGVVREMLANEKTSKRGNRRMEYRYRANHHRRFRCAIERLGMQEFVGNHRHSNLQRKVENISIEPRLPILLTWPCSVITANTTSPISNYPMISVQAHAHFELTKVERLNPKKGMRDYGAIKVISP